MRRLHVQHWRHIIIYYVYHKYDMAAAAADAMGSTLLWLTPAPRPSPRPERRTKATSGATLLINPPALPGEARGATIGRKVPAMTSRRGAYPLS